MRLIIKPIVSWCDVNMYAFGNQWTIRSGEPNTLYFQIVDADQAIAGNNQGIGIFSGITPVGTIAGLRHLLGIGAGNTPYSVMVTFPSIDGTQVLTNIAVQADAADSSIWKVSIGSNQLVGGGNVQFTIQEGSTVRKFSALNVLAVEFLNNGSC